MKAAPSVPIRLLEDAEDLEPPNDVLHGESDLGQSTIVSPLGVGKRVMLARFLGRPGVGMLVLNPLIASVGEELGVGMDGRLRLPQESKIMCCPATGHHADPLRGDRVDQKLQFQRVALLFPAIPVPLLSWAERHPYGACPPRWRPTGPRRDQSGTGE